MRIKTQNFEKQGLKSLPLKNEDEYLNW